MFLVVDEKSRSGGRILSVMVMDNGSGLRMSYMMLLVMHSGNGVMNNRSRGRMGHVMVLVVHDRSRVMDFVMNHFGSRSRVVHFMMDHDGLGSGFVAVSLVHGLVRGFHVGASVLDGGRVVVALAVRVRLVVGLFVAVGALVSSVTAVATTVSAVKATTVASYTVGSGRIVSSAVVSWVGVCISVGISIHINDGEGENAQNKELENVNVGDKQRSFLLLNIGEIFKKAKNYFCVLLPLLLTESFIFPLKHFWSFHFYRETLRNFNENLRFQ